MSQSMLTEIQMLNVALLHAIRTGVFSDRDLTRHRFQLTVEQAECIRQLTYADIEVASTGAAELSLFIPRANLVQLLTAPPGLVPMLASVRMGGRQNRMPRTLGRRQSDYACPSREVA